MGVSRSMSDSPVPTGESWDTGETARAEAETHRARHAMDDSTVPVQVPKSQFPQAAPPLRTGMDQLLAPASEASARSRAGALPRNGIAARIRANSRELQETLNRIREQDPRWWVLHHDSRGDQRLQNGVVLGLLGAWFVFGMVSCWVVWRGIDVIQSFQAQSPCEVCSAQLKAPLWGLEHWYVLVIWGILTIVSPVLGGWIGARSSGKTIGQPTIDLSS